MERNLNYIMLFLLLFTFSTKVKGQNSLYPITNKFEVIDYEIERNNKFLQDLQNGLIVWTRTVAINTNEVKVYIKSLSVEQLLPAGELCSPTFFFEYVRQLNGVLSNKRACPIQSGTTFGILQPYTETIMNPPKSCVGSNFVNFTLYGKEDKVKFLSLQAEISSSGQACLKG